MTKQEAKERIEKLKKEINRDRYAYHVLDKSLIPDEVLDSLKKELFDLELQYPEFVTPDSPTQRVAGEPLKEFRKVPHERPMISFNDAFSEKDMEDWLDRLENYLKKKIDREFFCELKLDGLSVELVYDNGVFVRGSTRGDGLVGEDVTQNLRTIEDIPLKLEGDYPKHLVVRGEVILSKKEFERINKEQKKKGEKLYANPRNIASGSVRQLDPKITASRNMDSFQYDIVVGRETKTHAEEHALLKKWGFNVNPESKLTRSLEEVFDFHRRWGDPIAREKLDYEIDGIVVIVNQNKVFEEAGVIGKASRATIAYKFSPKEATTIVEDIRVQVGRTGNLTPVAVMKPVSVGGTTITHATLHNMDQIEKLDLKIGDTVVVSRAGDVIPQITKVFKELRTGKERSFKMPETCPVDGSPVIKTGVFYRCSNPKCGARNRREIRHFVSKAAFNIEGLGPKIIDRFMDEGLISDAADIWSLQKGDIASLEKFGEKSADNLINEIEARKKVGLARFIYSLGILHVGEETANTLAKDMAKKSGKKTFKPGEATGILESLSKEELEELPDIGPKVAESFYSWFKDKRNIHLLEKLDKSGIEIRLETPASGKLSGKTFVLTGTLETMSREQAKEKIRALGGDISESVGSKTDYLVAGIDPGSKYNRAKEIGVKILDEKEFLRLI
ncbi:MAG TPA: NAD-dependent DNA ligase LigA [Candidatus Colwellbacteria bacterium]|nr:NAD-dependent DNA ligase LigA [Candidatus Colwellbacteria bacterium]